MTHPTVRSPYSGCENGRSSCAGVRRVQRLVLRTAITLVGAGISIGTFVTLVAMQPLAFLLSDGRVADPMTIAATTAVFLA